jgi:RND family efflux transporter MFP subunit
MLARHARLLPLVLLLAATGCSAKPKARQPRVPVAVARAEQRTMPFALVSTGTVEAIRTAAVGSQVGGVITRVGFREGDEVAKGALLFQLDPRPFQNALAQANAMLARDRAQAKLTKLDADRAQALVERGAISQSEYDQKRAAADAAQASVASDEAQARAAQLSLSYASIRAPISGRTGRLLVHEGDYVKPQSSDALVTVNQTKPVRVAFTVPVDRVPDVQRYRSKNPRVQVSIPGEAEDQTIDGALVFADNAVDPASGTLMLKGEFPNLDGRLVAGTVRRRAAGAVLAARRGGRAVAGGDRRAAGKLRLRAQCRFDGRAPPGHGRARRGRVHDSVQGPQGRRDGDHRRAAQAFARREGDGEMNLSAPWIKRPVMTTLVMVGILIFGIVGYTRLPVSDVPNVDYPVISVSANLPGASPETMASAVAAPLEKQFTTIAGLDAMTSSSTTGQTNITLQFALDRDIDAAAQDVQSAMSKTLRSLPQGIIPPSYQKVNPADSPILFLAMTSPLLSMSQLDEYAENVLTQRISTVKGVAAVNVFGAQKYAVRIQLDPGPWPRAGSRSRR